MSAPTLSPAEQTLLDDFETINFDPEKFDHSAHVHVTWAYLRKFHADSQRFDKTLDALVRGLKHITVQLGAEEKYNQTITEALVKLIAHAYGQNEEESYEAFSKACPALFGNFKDLLTTHYSEELLFSEEAKTRFIEPDLMPL